MVRWGTDQPYTGYGVPGIGYVLGDLVPWQLSALSGFGSLRHFDLQIVAVGEVRARHSKPSRCHLRSQAILDADFRVRYQAMEN